MERESSAEYEAGCEEVAVELGDARLLGAEA